MSNEIRVPDIGDFDAVDVIEVLIKAGDSVENGHPERCRCRACRSSTRTGGRSAESRGSARRCGRTNRHPRP